MGRAADRPGRVLKYTNLMGWSYEPGHAANKIQKFTYETSTCNYEISNNVQ